MIYNKNIFYEHIKKYFVFEINIETFPNRESKTLLVVDFEDILNSRFGKISIFQMRNTFCYVQKIS